MTFSLNFLWKPSSHSYEVRNMAKVHCATFSNPKILKMSNIFLSVISQFTKKLAKWLKGLIDDLFPVYKKKHTQSRQGQVQEFLTLVYGIGTSFDNVLLDTQGYLKLLTNHVLQWNFSDSPDFHEFWPRALDWVLASGLSISLYPNFINR